jgi:translation initiation factor IF-2
MRISEVAKKIGIPAKEVIAILNQLGMTGRHHAGSLSDEETQQLFDYLKSKSKTPSKAAEPKPKKTVKEASPSRVETALKTKQTSQPFLTLVPPATNPPLVSISPGVRSADVRVFPPKGPVSVSSATHPVKPARTQVKPDPAPPPVEVKKTFVLIKKKVAPVLPVEPAVELPVPLALQPEVAVSPVAVAPVVEQEEASPAAPSVLPTMGHVLTPAEVVANLPKPVVTPVVTTTAEEKGEKKKGKIEVKLDFKKPVIGKQKEKGGGNVLAAWDPAAATSTEAPGAEKRKWQDFSPTHKRQERRGIQKGVSPAPVETTKPRRKVIKLYEGLTVREFSELVGEKVSTIISKLMEMGKAIPVNQPIGMEEALFLSELFEVKAELASERTEEEILRPSTPPGVDDPLRWVARPPVVTIMGHVDHGKTSLLDAIRQTKVVEGEAGGITQHIGAYTVSVNNKTVTFIDTPGHEAFTAMRARGAKVTDIVILVVAADDGVMPQTVEAINHAKAANVPIIVAINKIDKPNANTERVRTALTEYELVSEEWGGKTIFAEISAKKRIGLEHLLEMILLQAEVLELKGNPQKPMEGVIIEAKLDRGRGPVATVLVQEGTLKAGDAFVAGSQAGRVRVLIDDVGRKVKEATPAMPVEVIGFMGVPFAGDKFVVTIDERVAKEVAQERMHRQRLAALARTPRTSLLDMYAKIKEGELKELRLVIKADVQGSAGALSEAIEKLSTEAVKVRVIHKGVGGVTESDILLASASDAIVIGFNVRPDPSASLMAEKTKIDLRLYNIIYNAIEDVRKAMEGLLSPIYTEKVVGRADVKKTFQVPRAGMICGCQVSSGTITRSGGTKARVIRDSVVVYEGVISSLRRFKDDVKEVATGFECGIGIENFNDIKVGDIIEAYAQEETAAKL